ncbi:hypothetical protein [Phocaeicola vulgatus]|uniref:hypothetical protein n=1 Tax=Phocaeicola vulgatus TaxID=821 RepID=UPI0021A9AA3D|nr:hypothetical protein [Phocaeicola vulgatus]
MNRYLSFTLFTGLSLLTTIPIEAYTLNPNKTATSILQTNVIEVRSITSVQPIVIYCPVGTVPQLPYQVWVTYSDGQVNTVKLNGPIPLYPQNNQRLTIKFIPLEANTQ